MKKLLVVWKSDNKIDIDNFIMTFAYNSKNQGWFDDVEILIWGSSQKKVASELVYQDKVKELIGEGIRIFACKWCADNVGVTKMLESLGVNVMYTGVYLSDKLKDPNYEVITI